MFDYSIVNNDSFIYIKNIADNSIDCVITDPPYFIDGMQNNWNVETLNNKVKKSNVIGSLPIGMKFDIQQGKDLQNFISRISTEIFRVLKPGGFYLSFSQARLYHRMAIAIEDCGFEIRDMLIWKRESQAKAFTQNHFVHKYMNDISEQEKQNIIQQLDNRKTPQLKGQSEPIVLAQKPKEGTYINNWLKYKVGLIDTNISLDGKFPGTIMEVAKPKGKERASHSHLTMKPVVLIEHLVKIFTVENALILDPFLGSGSTAIACLNTNRRFIGIELNNQYFTETQLRLENYIKEKNSNIQLNLKLS